VIYFWQLKHALMISFTSQFVNVMHKCHQLLLQRKVSSCLCYVHIMSNREGHLTCLSCKIKIWLAIFHWSTVIHINNWAMEFLYIVYHINRSCRIRLNELRTLTWSINLDHRSRLLRLVRVAPQVIDLQTEK
jgi:hypothetical protein